jgi:hypothetical protein
MSNLDPPPSAHELNPWEQPGVVRLDREPHRGGMLLLLGRIGSLCAMLTPVLLLPGVVGMYLGVIVWRSAREDLAKMQRGLMDPAGRGLTERARRHGWVAAIFIVSWLFLAAILLVLWP